MNAINMNYSKREYPGSPEGYGDPKPGYPERPMGTLQEQAAPESTIFDVLSAVEETTQVIEKNLMSLELRISPILRSVVTENSEERIERDRVVHLKPRMLDLLEKLSAITAYVQNIDVRVEL